MDVSTRRLCAEEKVDEKSERNSHLLQHGNGNLIATVGLGQLLQHLVLGFGTLKVLASVLP